MAIKVLIILAINCVALLKYFRVCTSFIAATACIFIFSIIQLSFANQDFSHHGNPYGAAHVVILNAAMNLYAAINFDIHRCSLINVLS